MSATETAPSAAGRRAETDETVRVFSRSVVISGIRCTLAYVVFPWILPLLHISDRIGPWIGLAIGVVAAGFNLASIRRFWRADHRWKWPITVLNVSVIVLLTILFVEDLRTLLS